MADGGHGDRRRKHQPDREQRQRPHVPSKIAQRREECGRIQERRQDRDEHDIRSQRDMRDARNEADRQTAENEQDRIRDPQERREREQRAACSEEREQRQSVMR